jgi:hypothetical protein
MKPTHKTIKSQDLKKGDWFIIIGKRKERWVNKVIEFEDQEQGRTVLVFTDNCRQLTFKPDENVYFVKNQSADEIYGEWKKAYFTVEWYEKQIEWNEDKLKSVEDFSTTMSGRAYTDEEIRATIRHNIEGFKQAIQEIKNQSK